MGKSRRPARILDEVGESSRPFLGGPGAGGGEAGSPEERAFQRGREQGYQEGLEHAAAEFEELTRTTRQQLAEALQRIAEFEEHRTRDYERMLAGVVIEAASRIARARIEQDDPVAVRVLQEAIGALPPTVVLRAHLNPSDLESVARELAEETRRGRLELVPDEAISKGGCRVESPAGTIDATWETALDEVRDAITGGPEAS